MILSSAEYFVRHHKQQTDRAISAAFVHLAADEPARECLNELLNCVRFRAPRLLEDPVVEGRHLGIEALLNLAGFRNEP